MLLGVALGVPFVSHFGVTWWMCHRSVSHCVSLTVCVSLCVYFMCLYSSHCARLTAFLSLYVPHWLVSPESSQASMSTDVADNRENLSLKDKVQLMIREQAVDQAEASGNEAELKVRTHALRHALSHSLSLTHSHSCT